jgi:hypothetical protein
MRQISCFCIGLVLLAAVGFAGLTGPKVRDAPLVHDAISGPNCPPPADACFAPGTTPEYIARWRERIGILNSLDYELASRWQSTATNGGTGGEGSPITLTYSFVPDGTILDGHPSRLFARMNTLFGTPAIWQPRFAQIFEEWSQVTGVHYVYQPTDDGAAWPDTPGALGVRGDLRLGMISIDGPLGVLAYDYYPDFGDMALDSAENWAAPGQNLIFLRNVASHEHGHGLGLAHVCPENNTKLMEPFYSTAFDGPQHDDIRGSNRFYGDRFEPNNTPATATRFGRLTADTTIQNLSMDHVTDNDYFQIVIPAGQGMTILLEPIGRSYLNGPQNPNGSCSAGDPINSQDDLNLDLYLYNWNGGALLAQSASHPAGVAEEIFHYPVSQAGDSFIVKVAAGGLDSVQIYRLTFQLFNLADPYMRTIPIAFDSTLLGTQVVRSEYLVNGTSVSRNIVSAQVATAFYSVTPGFPQSIPAHDSLLITVTYLATTLGTQVDTLRIVHDGPGGTIVCPLSGATVVAQLRFVFNDSVSFGDVMLGSSDSVGIPVRNQGNIPLVLQSIAVQPPFSITFDLPRTLMPTEAVFLRPHFNPTILGPVSAMMTITHSGVNSPTVAYLSGTGIPVAAEELPGGLPTAYRLGANFPNPFNPVTRIEYDLPRTADVRLQVFDVSGRLVSELVNGTMPAGRYAAQFDGERVASGLYFYRLSSPEFTAMGKMVLLK